MDWWSAKTISARFLNSARLVFSLILFQIMWMLTRPFPEDCKYIPSGRIGFLSSTTHMLIMSQRTQIGNRQHPNKASQLVYLEPPCAWWFQSSWNHWYTMQCNCKQMGRSCIWIGSTAGHAWMRDRCRLHSVLVLLASTIILASRVDIVPNFRVFCTFP